MIFAVNTQLVNHVLHPEILYVVGVPSPVCKCHHEYMVWLCQCNVVNYINMISMVSIQGGTSFLRWLSFNILMFGVCIVKKSSGSYSIVIWKVTCSFESDCIIFVWVFRERRTTKCQIMFMLLLISSTGYCVMMLLTVCSF